MLKLCGDSIYVPLEIIFNQALLTDVFPYKWEKGNTKYHKKIFKTIDQFLCIHFVLKHFKNLFLMTYLTSSPPINLSLNKSPVSSDSCTCIRQLLSITHEIFTTFDNRLQVRSLSLHISIAFDKVRYEGLILKLKQNGIFGQLHDSLSNR